MTEPYTFKRHPCPFLPQVNVNVYPWLLTSLDMNQIEHVLEIPSRKLRIREMQNKHELDSGD